MRTLTPWNIGFAATNAAVPGASLSVDCTASILASSFVYVPAGTGTLSGVASPESSGRLTTIGLRCISGQSSCVVPEQTELALASSIFENTTCTVSITSVSEPEPEITEKRGPKADCWSVAPAVVWAAVEKEPAGPSC